MNYGEILEAAFSYSDRTDSETTASANVKAFTEQAEARINRLLKTRKQSTLVF